MMSRICRAVISGAASLALVMASASSAAAQQTGSISGTVLDAATEAPLVGAQVVVAGTQLGGQTNAQGRFLILNVPAGERTLQVFMLGYADGSETVTVTPGSVASATIRLDQSVLQLDEVVVTGVSGATVKAKVPFVVENVRAADIVVPATSPATALQGKVAGVQVVSGSGRPGAPPSILLRGPVSLDASGRDQEPLYIVDGVILGGDMVDLAAVDIESIEVIKGAAAASLYGSRAANGVIQIQTRRGSTVALDQIRYTVRSQVGQSNMPKTPDALVAKKHPFAMKDGRLVDATTGEPCDYTSCSGVKLAGQAADGGPINQWNTYQNQEWPGGGYDQVERFFSSGMFYENYIAAEGRAGATNFHASYSNTHDEGVMIGRNGLTRHAFRVNLDQGIRPNLHLSASTFYSTSESDFFPESQGNPMFRLTRARAGVNLFACEDDPSKDCRDRPENLILRGDPFNTESGNPIYELLTRTYSEERGRFLGSMNLRYTPVSWMDIDANASYDRLDFERQDHFPKGYRTTTKDDQLNDGYLDRLHERTQAFNASITATFRKNFGENLRTRTALRYLYEQQDHMETYTEGWRFSVADVPVFDNVDPTTVGAESLIEAYRSDGYFAITNLDLYDRYIIDALVRNDGSSLFGENERRHWYYRIAGAWRLGEEPWFNLPAVDELKLRYAYGTAGSRPNFEAQYETFSVSGGSVTPVTLGNSKLKPEFSAEHEVGVDASFLNGRFVFGLTHANTTTKDQILRVPLPAYTGYALQWQNAGTIQSKTWEASLEARLVQTENLSWHVRLLYDRTRSVITELNRPPFQYGVPGQNLGNVFYAREGEEVGTFYGTKAATSCADLPTGFDCSEFAVNDDGLLVWVGDGSLSDNRWGEDSGLISNGSPVMWGTVVAGQCTDPSTGERTYTCPVGNSMPDYSIGFSSTLNWGGLSIYGLLDAVQGFSVYNQPLQWAIFAETAGLYDQTGPLSEQKPMGYTAAMYGHLGGLMPSSLFTEDGSFVKLREVAVRYRVNQAQLTSIPGLGRLSGVTLSLTGRNLYTWTDYRGYDPEVGKSGGDTGSSALARVEGFQYPNFRTWTLGLELNF